MPTGYTAGIEDGLTFPEFIRRCARGFGALIEMRDDPMDAPFPTEIKANTTYYDERIAKAKETLNLLNSYSSEQINTETNKFNQLAMIEWEENNIADHALREKYEKMLVDINAWVPPTTTHNRLKTFMIEQVKSSIAWDCGHYDEPPVALTPKEWFAHMIKDANRDVRYYEKERNEAVKRAAERNKWLQDLVKSLPPLELKTT